ncbi:hypothetical protein HED60_07125 [Planctomycetales bacterium ZRK34]|nr:hypothetical protein HED60_07125 [Planctomycetales bacterium ZRK34]
MVPVIPDNPVDQTMKGFPSGPALVWLIAGIPLALVAGYVVYLAIRSAYDTKLRFKRRTETDPLERNAAINAMDNMDHDHDPR